MPEPSLFTKEKGSIFQSEGLDDATGEKEYTLFVATEIEVDFVVCSIDNSQEYTCSDPGQQGYIRNLLKICTGSHGLKKWSLQSGLLLKICHRK